MVHLLPLYPAEVRVQWTVDVNDPLSPDLTGMTFAVQRSGSPGGPWETRAAGLTGVVYEDPWQSTLSPSAAAGRAPIDNADLLPPVEENLLSINREYYYRVVATNPLTQETWTSGAIDNEGMIEPLPVYQGPGIGLVPRDEQTLPLPNTHFESTPASQRRLQLVQRVQLRRAAIALRVMSGVEVLVLKKRHFGERCNCNYVESITKAVLVSKPASPCCYGTGWKGGYFTAIPTLGRLIEATPAVQTESEGRTNVLRGQFSLLHWPRLEKDDILVEVDSNRRWVVNDDTAWRFRRRTVVRNVTCTELARTSVAYQVPVT